MFTEVLCASIVCLDVYSVANRHIGDVRTLAFSRVSLEAEATMVEKFAEQN